MFDLYFHSARLFVSLTVGGALVGVLHRHHGVVALILGVILLTFFWQNYKLYKPFVPRGVVLICGAFLTGCLGVMAELWGIRNGYWEYHNLAPGREFPLWLPFAWSLTFIFLYRIEELFIECLQLRGMRVKLLLAALFSAFFPAWGEMVTVNLGVWTYAWPHQLFGIPALAVVLLTALHTSIYLVLMLLCQRYQIRDPVFGPRA